MQNGQDAGTRNYGANDHLVAAEEYSAVCVAIQVAHHADAGADTGRFSDGAGECRRAGPCGGCHQCADTARGLRMERGGEDTDRHHHCAVGQGSGGCCSDVLPALLRRKDEDSGEPRPVAACGGQDSVVPHGVLHQRGQRDG